MTSSSIRPIRAPDGSVIERPGKLMRIAAVARAMLDEARSVPCDEAGCERLRAIYVQTIDEFGELLSSDLRQELDHLTVTLDSRPSASEVRIAQAELVGWLEGLFHTIAAAASDPAQGDSQHGKAVAAGAGAVETPGHYL